MVRGYAYVLFLNEIPDTLRSTYTHESHLACSLRSRYDAVNVPSMQYDKSGKGVSPFAQGHESEWLGGEAVGLPDNFISLRANTRLKPFPVASGPKEKH